MLRALEIKNFTVFEEAKLEFSPGLNVVIGENGTGKSHLLKLGYILMKFPILYNGQKFTDDEFREHKALPSYQLRQMVRSIFNSEKLINLFSYSNKSNSCTVEAFFHEPFDLKEFTIGFIISKIDGLSLTSKAQNLKNFVHNAPLLIPTKEILSIYSGFSAALRNRELEFDSTYLDLADVLALTPLKGERVEQIKPIIETLEKQMDGKVIVENGRFYIVTDNHKLEMPLVAEGIRKIAMLAYLLINGSLQKGTTLFWDEPETNLNPKMIRHLAETLVILSSMGIQIVLATHSLFLLRELQIQLTLNPNVPAQFFALKREGKSVTVQQGNSIEDVDPIAALDADLEQSDRYLELT
jgi:energy-coupling factor transporter ATP-binding protein EcfA2